MENLFVKEVVNGMLIEIEILTVGKMLKVSMDSKHLEEYEKLAHVMCSVLKINGERVKPKDFLESDDFTVFNFISDAFNAMTNNNLL